MHYVGEYVNTLADDSVAEGAITGVGWSVSAGQMYFDTTNAVMKYYDGSSWQTLGTSTPPSLESVLAQGDESNGQDIKVDAGASGAAGSIIVTPDATAGGGNISIGNPGSGGGGALTIGTVGGSGGTFTCNSATATFSGGAVSVTGAGSFLVEGSSSFTVNQDATSWTLDNGFGSILGSASLGDGSSNTGLFEVEGGSGAGTISVKDGGTLQVLTGGNATVADLPTAGIDIANKNYVDSIAAGLSWKDAVLVATSQAVTLNTDVVAGQTLNGVNLAADDRVLVKDQVLASENGIYVVQAGGNPPVRSDDCEAGDPASGAAVFVQQGTVFADTGWVQTAEVNWGGNAVFAQFTGGGALTPGNGISISGSTISVRLAFTGTSGLEFEPSSPFGLQIAGAAAGDGLTGGGGSALAVNVGTGLEISADTVRIAAAAAGDGLTGGGGSALAVNVGTGLEIDSDAVRIAAAAAGDGLTGGGGSALAVNVGDGLEISSDQVNVVLKSQGGLQFDPATPFGIEVVLASGGGLEFDPSTPFGIQIASSALGDGLSGGSGTTIAVDLATDSGLEFNSGDLRVASTIAGDGLIFGLGVIGVDPGQGIEIVTDQVAVDIGAVSSFATLDFDISDGLIVKFSTGNGEINVDGTGLRVTGLQSNFRINNVVTTGVTAAALNDLVSASNDVGDTYHDHDSIYGRVYTGSGTPVSSQTGSAGDIYVDTTNSLVYMHYSSAPDNTSWTVVG